LIKAAQRNPISSLESTKQARQCICRRHQNRESVTHVPDNVHHCPKIYVFGRDPNVISDRLLSCRADRYVHAMPIY